MRKNKYFVSYNLIIDGEPTPGNMTFDTDDEIKQMEDIEEIEKALLKTFKSKFGDAVQGAILMNFIKL